MLVQRVLVYGLGQQLLTAKRLQIRVGFAVTLDFSLDERTRTNMRRRKFSLSIRS